MNNKPSNGAMKFSLELISIALRQNSIYVNYMMSWKINSFPKKSSYVRKMFVPRRITPNEKFHYNMYEPKKCSFTAREARVRMQLKEFLFWHVNSLVRVLSIAGSSKQAFVNSGGEIKDQEHLRWNYSHLFSTIYYLSGGTLFSSKWNTWKMRGWIGIVLFQTLYNVTLQAEGKLTW